MPPTASSSPFAASSLLPKLLPTIFPALLPPADGVDYEFYTVMGFTTSDSDSNNEPCTAATLRSHYKRLSLQYHPDKNPTPEAAAHYTRIQQAHSVLNDPHQRQLYDALGRSVARYESVSTGSFLHPTTVLYHVGAARMGDKTRLVVCWLCVLLLLCLVPILVVVRWNQEQRRSSSFSDTDTTALVPWMVVLLPVWVALAIALIGQGIRLVTTTTTATGVVWLLELIAWCTGMVLTVLQWDDVDVPNSTTAHALSWHRVAIPFYCAHALHILKGYLSLRAIQVTQAYMISELYLREELHVEEEQELTPEQQQQYTVVTTDHETVAQILAAMEQQHNDTGEDTTTDGHGLDKEELEVLRVHTSPEFTAAEQAMQRLFRSTLLWILFYVPLTILIAFQLGSWNKAVSWWIIFIPLWIYWGFPLLFHFFVCCCAGPPLDENDEGGEEDDIEKADDGQTDSQANTSQMMFQSVDGSMSQLNSFNTSVDSAGMNNMSNVSMPPNGGDVAAGASPTKQTSATATTAPTTTTTTTTTTPMKREEPNIAATASPIPPSTSSPTMPRSHGDDDDDFPELTPEFVDAKFKALAACCGSTVQIGLLCMVVALLQDPDAYNAMWILFPGFVCGGLLLCLCCCCIYAPPLVDAQGNPLHTGGGGPDANAENDEDDDLFVYKMDTPKHMVQPPAVPPSAVANHTVSGTSIPEEGDVEAQNETGLAPTTAEAKDDDGGKDPTASSMDDLD